VAAFLHVVRVAGGVLLAGQPETVAAYIAECARRLKPGTIQRRLNAITEAHKASKPDSPTHASIVRNTLKGIRRTKGTSPAQKTAALTERYPGHGRRHGHGLDGVRDRALILLGFACAFRNSWGWTWKTAYSVGMASR
jgi:hypothetical protein